MSASTIDTVHLPVAHDFAHKWQQVLDVLARVVAIPAALIMRVEPPQIKVFLASHSDGNPYEEEEAAPLCTGLYCETVMATRKHLIVPNALTDKDWCQNPDVKLGMISYMGLPLIWPDDSIFGTICVLDRQENAYTPLFLQLLQQFRSLVERDLKQIYNAEVRAAEDAALRAEEAERVRQEFAELRASEQKALEKLQALNSHLEERVAERTHELQRAMEQILVTEKMAALGRLVAGVAHELNTPVGNIVLSASALRESFDDIGEQVAGNRLSRHRLEQFLQQGHDSCELLERNSRHAAQLIMSFKQVAVDQSSELRRSFDLRTALEDMVAALGPTIRRANVQLDVRIPPDIVMDSCPGPMEQVIINLVTNSITHGFEGRDGGRIVIDALQRGDTVELSYQDDGCGIPPELQGKVFDPFFTTKMGRGGSGLGLAIVHNIAQAVLKGSVRLESEPDHGARFVFSLPRVLP